MPLVVVIVPAAAFAIFGRLPPARTAAPAALLVVSHLSLLVNVSSGVFSSHILTVTVARRYVNDISLPYFWQAPGA